MGERDGESFLFLDDELVPVVWPTYNHAASQLNKPFHNPVQLLHTKNWQNGASG